jgi:hypothetical protein
VRSQFSHCLVGSQPHQPPLEPPPPKLPPPPEKLLLLLLLDHPEPELENDEPPEELADGLIDVINFAPHGVAGNKNFKRG